MSQPIADWRPRPMLRDRGTATPARNVFRPTNAPDGDTTAGRMTIDASRSAPCRRPTAGPAHRVPLRHSPPPCSTYYRCSNPGMLILPGQIRHPSALPSPGSRQSPSPVNNRPGADGDCSDGHSRVETDDPAISELRPQARRRTAIPVPQTTPARLWGNLQIVRVWLRSHIQDQPGRCCAGWTRLPAAL